MKNFRAISTIGVFIFSAGHAGAVDIVVDFSLDQGTLFNDPSAVDTINRAAAIYSRLLTDQQLDSIDAVLGYTTLSQSVVRWESVLTTVNPSTGAHVTVNTPILADEFRIYVGSASLSAGALGGAYSSIDSYVDAYIESGTILTEELQTLSTIGDVLEVQMQQRGKSLGEYSHWGSSIVFDDDGSTVWNTGSGASSTTEHDLFSVAMHEIGHTLGFASSEIEWYSQLDLSNSTFTGAASTAANGGVAPDITLTGGGHWDYGMSSDIPGFGVTQEALYDPDMSITETRKLLTELDIAGLEDLGWDVDTSFEFILGDLDLDGDVDDADLGTVFSNYTGPIGTSGGKTVWDGDVDFDGDVDDADLGTVFSNYTGPLAFSASNVVPEPTSFALLGLGGLMLIRRRRS